MLIVILFNLQKACLKYRKYLINRSKFSFLASTLKRNINLITNFKFNKNLTKINNLIFDRITYTCLITVFLYFKINNICGCFKL